MDIQLFSIKMYKKKKEKKKEPSTGDNESNSEKYKDFWSTQYKLYPQDRRYFLFSYHIKLRVFNTECMTRTPISIHPGMKVIDVKNVMNM